MTRDEQTRGWPEVFSTNRLVLRPPTLDDATAIFETYAQDSLVTKYLEWRPHRQLGDAKEYLESCRAGWDDGTALTWMLTSPADDRVLGAIAVHLDGHKAGVGYVLARPFWGQGLMAEAGRALLGHASRIEEIHRVWAVCDVDNCQSARVLEKIGMEREGVLHSWIIHPNVSALPRDVLCYAWVRPTPAAPR